MFSNDQTFISLAYLADSLFSTFLKYEIITYCKNLEISTADFAERRRN